jgi:hypothetical protein
MNTFRIVFGVLALIPFGLLADKFFFHLNAYDEDSLQTLVFHFLGMPILILNMWAWFEPEIIEFYFFGREPKEIYNRIKKSPILSEYDETN